MKTNLHLFYIVLVLGSFVFFSNNFAQTAPLQYTIQSYQFESDIYDGDGTPGTAPSEILIGVIEVHNSPWLRLHFSNLNLGQESYLVIRSLYDNHWQKLDALSMKQWNNYSAFFNGNAVEIKLFLASTDRQIFINIDEVIVGEWYQGDPAYSQCGPTDDRMASNQPATARLLSIGCTTWIIPNGKFVSAGHCLDGSGADVVEFNVPLSLPNGTLQHPGPEDQYSVNVSTKIFTNNGVGDDWGVFEVYPNSITGLMPKQAQNAYWPLVQDLGPDSIRITGYGVDDGTANQTQQTHIGPNAGSSGTTMRYVTDTEGGNSGSPVIDGLTNSAVGVHTHGGCGVSSGNNNGTSTFHTAFWAAVDQGAGGCPVELPSNPNPTNGQTGIPLNLSQLTWSNGAGALTNELYFGTNPNSLNLVQSGSLATSWTITGVTFTYGTTYYWRVIELGDTCDTNGPVWTFKTVQDPNLVIDTVLVYPQNANYWTGTTTAAAKTEVSIMRIVSNGGEQAWAKFDISSIPVGATITAITANWYITNENCPYFQINALPIDPVTAAPATLYTAITGGAQYFLYNTCPDPGWMNEVLGGNANTDLTASIPSGWFAIGFYEYETLTNYTFTADGWSQTNKPYLEVVYEYVVPVELTSFTAKSNDADVEITWTTATETNNKGFDIERMKSDGVFEQVGYVPGFGTTTEPKSYLFVDTKIGNGKYSYRLKQIDFNGSFSYSQIVEIEIVSPTVFGLEQNYPNPFNPNTTIRFSIPVETDVRLNVFNALGQEVAEIINSRLKEGYHEVEFDAGTLTSGIYFYRLEADKFVDVKKMIIIK
jgi:V8-like Glu-specific endopeptidase